MRVVVSVEVEDVCVAEYVLVPVGGLVGGDDAFPCPNGLECCQS